MNQQEREQRRRQAKLPLKDRLLWLDSALQIAHRIQAGRLPLVIVDATEHVLTPAGSGF